MALVMELGLNEGSGTTTADSSGNGFNCTTGSGGWATGHTDDGYAATSTNPVQWPVIGIGSSVYTILAWVYRTGTPGAATTVCNAGTSGAARWALQSTGAITALGGRTTGVIPLNTWTHVAFVANGTTNRTCYVDGTQVDQDTGTAAFLSSSATYALTSSTTSYIVWDDVRVYNHALTVTEVGTAMSTPVGGASGTTGTLAAALPTITVGPPTSAITGTTAVPTFTGAVAASTPMLTVGPPTAAFSGTATAPTFSGTLAASTPTVTVGPPTVGVTGSTSDPGAIAGAVAASLPTVTVGPPTMAMSGTVTVPTYSGGLAAATAAVTVGPPTVALAGTVTAPTITGSLNAALPTITVGPMTTYILDADIPPLPVEGVSLTLSAGPSRNLTTTPVGLPDPAIDVTFALSATAQPRVILTAEPGAGIEWVDPSTQTVLSTSLTPTLPAGNVLMRATSPSAVHSVNFGFNSTEDAGNYNIGPSYNWPTQPLTGVTGLNGLTGLTYFMCNSATLVGHMDLTGMANLLHFECYHAQLTGVTLTGCDSMVRLCLEANRVSTLDLNPVAGTLRDLRMALNSNCAFATLVQPMAALYHHCTRGQNASGIPPLSMLPAVEEYWVWSMSRTVFSTPGSTILRSLLAYSNQLTQAAVDDILVALDTLGRPTGTVRLDLGTNSPPSAIGATAAGNLIAKGWTVQTN